MGEQEGPKTQPQTQDTMKDSIYHSMDAPMAPIEKKVEGLKPAEKAFFVLDLCVDCVASSLGGPGWPLN